MSDSFERLEEVPNQGETAGQEYTAEDLRRDQQRSRRRFLGAALAAPIAAYATVKSNIIDSVLGVMAPVDRPIPNEVIMAWDIEQITTMEQLIAYAKAYYQEGFLHQIDKKKFFFKLLEFTNKNIDVEAVKAEYEKRIIELRALKNSGAELTEVIQEMLKYKGTYQMENNCFGDLILNHEGNCQARSINFLLMALDVFKEEIDEGSMQLLIQKMIKIVKDKKGKKGSIGHIRIIIDEHNLLYPVETIAEETTAPKDPMTYAECQRRYGDSSLENPEILLKGVLLAAGAIDPENSRGPDFRNIPKAMKIEEGPNPMKIDISLDNAPIHEVVNHRFTHEILDGLEKNPNRNYPPQITVLIDPEIAARLAQIETRLGFKIINLTKMQYISPEALRALCANYEGVIDFNPNGNVKEISRILTEMGWQFKLE